MTNFNQIIEKLNAEIRDNPKRAMAYIMLGQIHEMSGNIPTAIEIYQQALKENPNLWVATNNLAFHLSEPIEETQDLEKARLLALKSLELRPGNPDALDTLGWIYYQSGDLDKALGSIESAIAKNPNHPQINYHLGMVLYAKKRYEEAEIALRQALSQKADYLGKDEAEKTLERVLALKTDKEDKAAAKILDEDLAKQIITGEDLPSEMKGEESPVDDKLIDDIFESLPKKDQMGDSGRFMMPGSQ